MLLQHGLHNRRRLGLPGMMSARDTLRSPRGGRTLPQSPSVTAFGPGRIRFPLWLKTCHRHVFLTRRALSEGAVPALRRTIVILSAAKDLSAVHHGLRFFVTSLLRTTEEAVGAIHVSPTQSTAASIRCGGFSRSCFALALFCRFPRAL